MDNAMSDQLERIRKAYDMTVEQYKKGIEPMAGLPLEFKTSPDFKEFLENSKGCGSANPDIKDYLSPRAGMRFLDAGCSANLASYGFDKWPSMYYGVDISPALVKAMQKYALNKGIRVGGLFVADISSLPFDENFFGIAMMIGVLEYWSLSYVKDALKELARVLKPNSRLVLDIPNPEHRDYSLMIKLEEYLGRPHIGFSQDLFEETTRDFFKIERMDDSRVMIKYFLKSIKK
jgi:SAM-dependent methyltransferase